MMLNNKKIYAITGGIGSGKSTVSEIIRGVGFPVFSCDAIYSELLNDASFIEKLESLFGKLTDSNGFFDRKALARKVFSDERALAQLNGTAHPIIMQELFKKAKGCNCSLVFCEVPLLFENSFQDLFDGVIVVLRDKEERIKAVMNRSGLDRKQIEARMAAQCNYDEFDYTSFYLIENNEGEEQLYKKVIKILQKIV